MMLQQRRLEANLPRHKDYGIETASLAGNQLPFFSLLLFPENNNKNELSELKYNKN